MEGRPADSIPSVGNENPSTEIKWYSSPPLNNVSTETSERRAVQSITKAEETPILSKGRSSSRKENLDKYPPLESGKSKV